MRSNLLILLLYALIHTATVTADQHRHNLVEFREISQINLILRHEIIPIFTANDVIGDMQILVDDLNNYKCNATDCESSRDALTNALSAKNATLMSLFEIKSDNEEVLNRKKRSWDSFGKSLKMLGGVMDSDDRNILHNRFQILLDNQQILNDQLNQIQSNLNNPPSSPEALKAERDEINEVERELKHVQELIGLQALTSRFEKISAIIDAVWRTYFNRRIDGIFVTADAIEKFSKVRNSACGRVIDCIKNADADVQYDSRFIINLKVPVASENTLNLFEITHIPTDLNNHILMLKFPRNHFAFDNANKKIIALNENSLNACRKSEDDSTVIYCRAQDIIMSVNTDECLEKAFNDKIIDSSLCADKMDLLQSDGFGVVEIANGRFWIHTNSRKDVVVHCSKKEDEIRSFSKSQIFSLDFGCYGVVRGDGIGMTSYDATESYQLEAINSSISRNHFVDIIEMMSVSENLKSGFYMNFNTFKPKGLHKVEIVNFKAASADELRTLRAQHSEAFMVVIFVGILVMLFVALKKSKSYIKKFIPTTMKDVKEEEQQESVLTLTIDNCNKPRNS